MSDSNPVTGHPYGGRDDASGEDGLPGERPERDTVRAPDPEGGSGNASRAATEGAMSSESDGFEPTEGIPDQVDAPSPADATEGEPPGGSAANQSGRTPDR